MGDKRIGQKKSRELSEKYFLIKIHTDLYHFMKFCEEEGIIEYNGHIDKYNVCGITPLQIYKSKEEHEKATFLLAEGLGKAVENIINKV